MAFWIWLGRVRNPVEFITKLSFFIALSAAVNHLRAFLKDGPDRHGFETSFFDAAVVALPIGILGMMLLARMGRLQDQLEVLASTDVLTRLPNRRAMLEALAEDLAKGQSGRLLMADIDFFKRVNDTHGHSGGDICLQTVADMLRDICTESCLFARLGGEEFAVFLKDASAREACRVAKVISRGVSLNLSAVPERITLSVGIAATPPTKGLEDLMHRADEALYFAKAQGRARAVDWDTASDGGRIVAQLRSNSAPSVKG